MLKPPNFGAKIASSSQSHTRNFPRHTIQGQLTPRVEINRAFTQGGIRIRTFLPSWEMGLRGCEVAGQAAHAERDQEISQVCLKMWVFRRHSSNSARLRHSVLLPHFAQNANRYRENKGPIQFRQIRFRPVQRGPNFDCDFDFRSSPLPLHRAFGRFRVRRLPKQG